MKTLLKQQGPAATGRNNHTIVNFHQRRIDLVREKRIDTLFRLAKGAASAEESRCWCNLMCDEIKKRSPDQIRRLEIAKGLLSA